MKIGMILCVLLGVSVVSGAAYADDSYACAVRRSTVKVESQVDDTVFSEYVGTRVKESFTLVVGAKTVVMTTDSGAVVRFKVLKSKRPGDLRAKRFDYGREAFLLLDTATGSAGVTFAVRLGFPLVEYTSVGADCTKI